MHEIPGGQRPEIILEVERLNALEIAVVERFSGEPRNIQEGRFSASRLIGARLVIYIMEANSPYSNPEDLEATAYYSETYPELLSQMARGNWSGTRDYFLGEARDSIGDAARMLSHPEVFEEKSANEWERYGHAYINLAHSLGA